MHPVPTAGMGSVSLSGRCMPWASDPGLAGTLLEVWSAAYRHKASVWAGDLGGISLQAAAYGG